MCSGWSPSLPPAAASSASLKESCWSGREERSCPYPAGPGAAGGGATGTMTADMSEAVKISQSPADLRCHVTSRRPDVFKTKIPRLVPVQRPSAPQRPGPGPGRDRTGAPSRTRPVPGRDMAMNSPGSDPEPDFVLQEPGTRFEDSSRCSFP
ncbi:unnamed protein product [Pleuronectes platessa]|uniref:Uncharacterized protein n=1 Tax=Pleuronectes platessa TaxID=8262 RepID=A0A9N7YYU5_PLEPL|nr:unnamed protein product [Pleuronectes platessa]